MTNSKLSKFLVLYLIPASVMAKWDKTDPKTRKPAEEKMRAEWHQWMVDHAKMIKVTEACGKTKKITSRGTSDTKNDICLYSFIEAESHAAATKAFKKHPHLQIPNASIQVMAVRAL
jgi:hypothetical protein